MTPSERIKLISDIADKFAAEEWSLIDLTLRQFKLPWTEQWSGSDKRGYIVSMTEEANDDKLLSLADHLNINRPKSAEIPVSTSKVKELITKIELQKALMISVATGGPRIQQTNDEYKERRLQILSILQEIGVKDPNPFGDLWSWYGRWSDGGLPTYQSRRSYITDLFHPLLDNLTLLVQRRKIEHVEPTGWERVDRNVEKIIHLLETATNEEDFQAVGLICRESIISLAQAVYSPELHQSVDGINPSETDAKRMLENYIASELAGSPNEEIRRYVKNAYQLSIILQHKRNASFRQAALCVEATRSLINIVAIVSGHRDP